MTGDDALDLAQMAADDRAVEQLRSVRPDDVALALLRDLLADVEHDLPDPVPMGRGSTVLRLANETSSDPRVARGGAVVALLAAGIVGLGGVAAASTSVAPGNPLHGLGEAVRSAAGALVSGVKPPAPQPRPTASLAARPTPVDAPASDALPARPAAVVTPGRQVADAAHSVAAARQVAALLDQAEALLRQGRVAAAEQRLDTAEQRLVDVSAEDAPALRARLAELRAEVDAARAAPAPQRTTPADGPRPSGPPADRGRPSSAAKPAAEPRPSHEPQGRPSAAGSGRAASADRTPTSAPVQPSRLASTKPRA